MRAGGDGVWIIDSSQRTYRLGWVDYTLDFFQIPGVAFGSISVGSGGGVWGSKGT